MAERQNPWTTVASSSIEKVMLQVQKRLLPSTNTTQGVAELRQEYLVRKNILVAIDEAHVTLRHLQQIESRKAAPRAPRQARVPKMAAAAVAPSVAAGGAVLPIATVVLPDDPMDCES